MADGRERALIIGGGVAGLGTALALRRCGMEATVFEAAPQLPAVGAGLQIWVNGMVALDRLGVIDAIQSVGDPVETQEVWSARGKLLFRTPVADIAREYNLPPPMHIRRADLLQTLAGQLDASVLQLGAKCTGFEQDGTGVTVHFEDGREERGTVLIGADGVDSAIRAILLDDVEPRYVGYKYLRALLDHGEPSLLGKFILWSGRGDRFGVHSGPTWIYWFGVLLDPQGPDPESGRKQQLLARFGDFPPMVREMIDSTSEAAIGRADVRDLPPLPRWSVGRVVILGDAAHTTTPNGGRGAAEALDDAVVLAEMLAERTPVDAALRAFEARRKPPTAEIQKMSRRMGESLSWANPIACALRERMAKRVLDRTTSQRWRKEFASLSSNRAVASNGVRGESPAS